MKGENMYKFWYSEKQRQMDISMNGFHPVNTARLWWGKVVPYTECSKCKLFSNNKPSGKWDDYEYLGQGRIYSVRGRLFK
jgi:hypothetical protein